MTEDARAQGRKDMRIVFLDTNEAALRSYTALGFKPCERLYAKRLG